MKGTLKIFALIIICMALMAGCGSASAPVAETPSAPAPAVSEPKSEAVKPLPLKELHQLAALYERYNYGNTFSEGEPIYPTDGIAFGLLYQNDLLEPFWNRDMWSVPQQLLAEINAMFFNDLEQADLGGCNNYGGNWDNSPYTLALRHSEDLGGGKVSVTYDRILDDYVLTPVTYEFEPHQPVDVPDILSELYKTGDTVYRIISVTHRPDLLPETEPQTIEIATAEQLVAAAERINEGKFEHQFDRYILTADIDLAGIKWTPIGLNNSPLEWWWNTNHSVDPNLNGFNGIFDGQGYTIKNLTITEEQGLALLQTDERNIPDRKLSGAGFFYNIGSKGEVKNLNIVDASIKLPIDFSANYGIAAGILAANCGGVVENVYVNGDVQGVVDVGGMVGRLSGYEANGKLTDCVCDVNVQGNYAVGGLVGTSHYGIMNRCKSIGTVTAIYSDSVYKGEPPRNIGGMFGHSVGGEAYNCYCQAYVLTEVPSACVGGFAGLVEGGQINECSVNSSILGNWEVIDAYYRTEPQVEVK
ncbi:MAG: hypothetical protein IJF25_05905 [Oscillospiraceae bacterium]|nr:hypothetical protein [Oscillospiraceae bacterium]MBQ4539495.1 hypothetical protein [Oscillospiraceae bacterium]